MTSKRTRLFCKLPSTLWSLYWRYPCAPSVFPVGKHLESLSSSSSLCPKPLPTLSPPIFPSCSGALLKPPPAPPTLRGHRWTSLFLYPTFNPGAAGETKSVTQEDSICLGSVLQPSPLWGSHDLHFISGPSTGHYAQEHGVGWIVLVEYFSSMVKKARMFYQLQWWIMYLPQVVTDCIFEVKSNLFWEVFKSCILAEHKVTESPGIIPWQPSCCDHSVCEMF